MNDGCDPKALRNFQQMNILLVLKNIFFCSINNFFLNHSVLKTRNRGLTCVGDM